LAVVQLEKQHAARTPPKRTGVLRNEAKPRKERGV